MSLTTNYNFYVAADENEYFDYTKLFKNNWVSLDSKLKALDSKKINKTQFATKADAEAATATDKIMSPKTTEDFRVANSWKIEYSDLTSGIDLNNLRIAGNYMYSDKTVHAVNAPTTAEPQALITVVIGGNYCKQIYKEYFTDNEYVRTDNKWTGSNWSPWTKVFNAQDIADNLTTDDSHKVLSAKQGKVLNDKILGVNQSWHDVRASRKLRVTYTNRHDSPIMVIFTISAGAISVYIDGKRIAASKTITSGGYQIPITFIVPVGHTYRIEGGDQIKPDDWSELY